MSVITELAEGASKGLFTGIGGMFKDIRNALGGVDPDKRAEIESKLVQLETSISTAQADINKAEAMSTDKFVSRWRPAIGWICVFGFAWYFILAPITLFVFSFFPEMNQPKLPEFGSGELFSLAFAMLGIGGYRTFEKYKGITK